MKITILDKENPTDEDELILRCGELEEDVLGLIKALKNGNSKFSFYKDNSIVFIDISEILYFESVDDRVFAYTNNQALECKQKLYQLEEELPSNFLRASKAVIVNVKKIENLNPEFSGRIEATLCNDFKIIFSRMYVPLLKKHLGL